MRKYISQSQQMHIILDLDETCINSVSVGTVVPNELLLDKFSVKIDGVVEFVTYKRPHLDEFINFVLENHSLSVWSAGTRDYVLDIIKHIVPQNPRVVLWREHCEASLADTKCFKSVEWIQTKLPCTSTLGTPLLIDDLDSNTDCNGDYGYKIERFDVSNPLAHADTALLDCIAFIKSKM